MENSELKQKIENLLGEEVVTFVLKGKGMANNAYYLETKTGNKYLVKEERADKETDEQNNLIAEGNIIKRLNELDPNLPVPQVAFVSETLKMYCYKYIDGEMMIHAWASLSEENRQILSEEIGLFHARLGKLIMQDDAQKAGLQIDLNSTLGEEMEKNCTDFLADQELPEEWRGLVELARKIFTETESSALFQCIHNDAHNENIIVKDGKLESFIDFGDSEFADAHRDFCMYVRHHSDYVQYILNAYIQASGNELSKKRVVAFAFMRDLDEVAYYFHNPLEEQKRLQELPGIPVKQRVENYKRLLAEW